MNKGLSLWLDILRVVATLVVVISHFAYARFSGGDLQWFRDFNFGSDAVVVFFVVSGLVIAFAAERDGAVGKYAFNRLTRLWTVLIPALVLTLILDTWGVRIDPTAYPTAYYAPHTWFETIFRGATFSNEFTSIGRIRLGTNGPLWSLSYEAAYYALFGIVVFFSGMRRAVWVLVIAYVVGPPILLLMPAWLMGVAAWHIIKKGHATKLSRQSALVLACAPPLIYAALLWAKAPLLLLALSAHLLGGIHMSATFGFSDEFVWNCLLGGLAVAQILGMARLMQDVTMALPAIKWTAGASFSIYVTHYPLLHFWDAILPAGQGREMLMLAATLLCGFGFAALFERPIGQFRQILRSAITALRPPKAKAFDKTTSTLASRATFGTTSNAHSGSGSS